MSELDLQKLLEEPEEDGGEEQNALGAAADDRGLAEANASALIMGANTDLNTLGEVARKDADAFNQPMNGEILELRESSNKQSLP